MPYSPLLLLFMFKVVKSPCQEETPAHSHHKNGNKYDKYFHALHSSCSTTLPVRFHKLTEKYEFVKISDFSNFTELMFRYSLKLLLTQNHNNDYFCFPDWPFFLFFFNSISSIGAALTKGISSSNSESGNFVR